MEQVGHIIVRSRAFKLKKIESNISNYVNVTKYKSFVSFLETKKNRFRQSSEKQYELTDLLINDTLFQKFIKEFSNEKYVINHDEILNECWIVTSYAKKNMTRIHIFNSDPSQLENWLEILNDVLKEYDYVNGEQKYEILSIFPNK